MRERAYRGIVKTFEKETQSGYPRKKIRLQLLRLRRSQPMGHKCFTPAGKTRTDHVGSTLGTFFHQPPRTGPIARKTAVVGIVWAGRNIHGTPRNGGLLSRDCTQCLRGIQHSRGTTRRSSFITGFCGVFCAGFSKDGERRSVLVFQAELHCKCNVRVLCPAYSQVLRI